MSDIAEIEELLESTDNDKVTNEESSEDSCDEDEAYFESEENMVNILFEHFLFYRQTQKFIIIYLFQLELVQNINFETDLKVYDVLRMLQGLMASHHLSYSAIVDTIKIINLVLGKKKLPESEYIFKKVCTRGLNMKREYFCSKCMSRLDENCAKNNRPCENCESAQNDYFVSLPIKSSLCQIVKSNHNTIRMFRENLRKTNEGIITDIGNGSWYKTMIKKYGENFLTININTDGVAMFGSSKRKSLWPILVTLNDLPMKKRFDKRNVMVAGHWLSEQNVDIDLFFEPFIKELEDLFENGIEIDKIRYKIIVCCCCLDSVARAKLLKMKQFNGQFGCTFCLHTAHNQRYAYSENILHRSKDHYIKCNQKLVQLQKNTQNKETSVEGVKGKTCLLKCPEFDPMKQVPPDTMHANFQGVAKLLIKLWFDSKYYDKGFYIPPIKRVEIDFRLDHLQTYSECGRFPRKITEFHTWKANEFYNWIFLYARFCLTDGILQPPYYQNLLLLVECLDILHSDKISLENLDLVEIKVKKFVRDFERLYGKENMVFNIHLLLHQVDAVRMFGPLHNFSLFVFENFNGILGNFLRGPNGPLIQLCLRQFLYFKICYNPSKSINPKTIQYCKEVMQKGSTRHKTSNSSRKFERIVYNNKTFKSFKKFYVNFLTISTAEHCKKTKFNDSYIYYEKNFYRVEKILLDDNDFLYILGSPILVLRFERIPNYYQIDIIRETVIIKIVNRFKKCFFYKVDIETEALSIIHNILTVD